MYFVAVRTHIHTNILQQVLGAGDWITLYSSGCWWNRRRQWTVLWLRLKTDLNTCENNIIGLLNVLLVDKLPRRHVVDVSLADKRNPGCSKRRVVYLFTACVSGFDAGEEGSLILRSDVWCVSHGKLMWRYAIWTACLPLHGTEALISHS